ncbi:unnamed protein product [Phytophthora lilii]|uniref:Unnamed protein product n=1 Tax=Phytophthora lilii TaxID=2077276 RepID=A0A9W6WQD1_9STRA|nr:unnamed protein product [Phytophthora lilii]
MEEGSGQGTWTVQATSRFTLQLPKRRKAWPGEGPQCRDENNCKALSDPTTKSFGERLHADESRAGLTKVIRLCMALIDHYSRHKHFKSRFWSAWLNYVDDFNKLYPARKTTPDAVLRSIYRDKGYARMLESAVEGPGSKKVAREFQARYLDTLLRESNSSSTVFELFGINEAPFYLLSHPGFSTWTKFVKLTNKENPESTIITVLTASFDRKRLIDLLKESKMIPDTKMFATELLVLLRTT